MNIDTIPSVIRLPRLLQRLAMTAGILLLCLLLGCTHNAELGITLPQTGSQIEGQTIEFGFQRGRDVTVTTRGTLPGIAESRVMNFYLMIFDDAGKIVYGNYFDRTNQMDAATLNASREGWIVENLEPTVSANSHGTVKFSCIDVTGGHLYMIANLDNSIYTLSEQSLATIRTESELEGLVYRMRELSMERNGNFLMTGHTSVTIEGETVTPAGEEAGTWGSLAGVGNCVRLIRNDVKVNVKVGVVPGATTVRNEYDHAKGETVSVTQVIDDFEPTSWQVINMPKGSWLMPRNPAPSGCHAAASIVPKSQTGGFFNTEEIGFESEGQENYNDDPNKPRNVFGFSFYMLENHQDMKQTVSGIYHNRDKRFKVQTGDDAGSYDTENGLWEYAPEDGTYLVVKGVVKMAYDGEVGLQQTLNANVVYYIHLGDMTASLDNYCVERNTHYTYNVNICGVDKILVEVERDFDAWNETNEEQSGATGAVYVSQEEIVTFDAHYGQRVYRFNADNMLRLGDVSDLTWAVESPFGRNGLPYRVGPENDKVDVPTGLDYKWVHAMINPRVQTYIEPHAAIDGGERVVTNGEYPNYCQYNRWWPGDNSPELMDVMGLCKMLRTELAKYKQIRSDYMDPVSKEIPAAAREEFEAEVAAQTIFDGNHDILVTLFVDEFYYEADPITGEVRNELWHEFVNVPNRTLHIMCNAQSSKDGASTSIGTAVTLHQRAIQTIYNTNLAAEGWGVETIDEMDYGFQKFYNRSTEKQKSSGGSWYNGGTTLASVPCNSDENGRYNSATLIGLVAAANAAPVTTLKWGDYVDYTKTNATSGDKEQFFMRDVDDRAVMRYSWLSRNRDNNGNGIIEPDEIKWYIASINQLKELLIGDRGILSESRLYNIVNAQNEGVTRGSGATYEEYWKWRCHVVSSTKVLSGQGVNQPFFIWAEEGASIGGYSFEWQKPGRLSCRTVRNLDAPSRVRTIQDPDDHPYSIIQMTDNGDGTYTFDLSRMNDKSKAMNTTEEYLPMDEMSLMSRPANKFMTAQKGNWGNIVNGTPQEYTNNATGYNGIKEDLLRGVSRSPVGYRIPSLREMLVIQSQLSGVGSFWDAVHYGVVNYYSFGNSSVGGKGYDSGHYSWVFKGPEISIDNNVKVKILPVKTIE